MSFVTERAKFFKYMYTSYEVVSFGFKETVSNLTDLEEVVVGYVLNFENKKKIREKFANKLCQYICFSIVGKYAFKEHLCEDIFLLA